MCGGGGGDNLVAGLDSPIPADARLSPAAWPELIYSAAPLFGAPVPFSAPDSRRPRYLSRRPRGVSAGGGCGARRPRRMRISRTRPDRNSITTLRSGLIAGRRLHLSAGSRRGVTRPSIYARAARGNEGETRLSARFEGKAFLTAARVLMWLRKRFLVEKFFK